MQLAIAVLVALTPMRVTVDGVAGVQPGMTPAGRGIRIGSTRADVVRVYGRLPSRRNRFTGGRDYFVRGRTAELRLDVSPQGRVTQIAFGSHAAVRLDEGCA